MDVRVTADKLGNDGKFPVTISLRENGFPLTVVLLKIQEGMLWLIFIGIGQYFMVEHL